MKPIIGQIYQHKHGGLYRVDSIATHVDSKEKLVIYTHLYPFNTETWARPLGDWTEDRFREITHYEFTELFKRDRLEFQIEIGKARAANK